MYLAAIRLFPAVRRPPPALVLHPPRITLLTSQSSPPRTRQKPPSPPVKNQPDGREKSPICSDLQPQQHPASCNHRVSFSPCRPNLAKRGHGLTDGGLRPGTPLASSSLRHGSFFRTHPPGLRSCSAPPSRMTHPAAQPSSCQSDTRAAMILGRCLTA